MLFTGPVRRAIFLAAIPLLVIPLAFAACGDDDDSNATPTAAITATPTTPTAVASPSPTDSTPSGGAAGSDAAYMKAVCVAANDSFDPVIDAIGKDPSAILDPAKLQKILTPALSELTDRLSQIKAPPEFQEYQDNLTQSFKDVLEKAKAGKLTSVSDFSSAAEDVPPPPNGVEDRLRSAAQNEPECQQSVLFSTGIFGG